MKKRWIGGLLAFMMVMGTACASNRTEWDDSESMDSESMDSNAVEVDRNPMAPVPSDEIDRTTDEAEASGRFDRLSDLPSEAIVWGPGKETDEDGRPTACIALQAQYGHYDALFLQEEAPICLTFDEGYENGYTGQILDVLQEKGVTAIFFVTLDYVQKEPALVRRMILEGHAVGNHTAHHPNLTQQTLETAQDEVQILHEYVEEEFGYTMRYFRAPEGAISEQTMALVQSLGYVSMLWSFAYADWDVTNQPDPSEAFNKLTASVHPGAIYLLHAVSRTNAVIVGDFIDAVREQGYTFLSM